MRPFALTEESEARNWDDSRTREPFRSPKVRGIAQIKPHYQPAQRAGIIQLYRNKFGFGKQKAKYPKHTQLLVTYLPVDGSGAVVRQGQAAAVEVYARTVDWPKAQPSDPRLGTMQYVGKQPLPKHLPFPNVDQPGFFGLAVEDSVRTCLYKSINRPKALRQLGGERPGPDAAWHEIAALYLELAHELRDPLYAELAAELAAGP